MAIATQARIVAIVGPRAVTELLAEARDPASSRADQDEQAQARLQSALQAGDDLIAQFLPLPAPGEASDVLIRFALDEALYYLRANSKGGASESDHIAAERRRRDLAHMRKRGQWPGSAKGQRAVRPRIVESSCDFAQRKLTGLV